MPASRFELCVGHIISFLGFGAVVVPKHPDFGFNIDRPALRRLLADIEAGKIDCVVVYKVDRLSRSLLDFSRLMEVFDRHNVAFVAVTQRIDTSTSMGRLMLNVLLSFAQFEREIIAERTRDKIAASRRKGKYTGVGRFLATWSSILSWWSMTKRPSVCRKSSNSISSIDR